MEPLDPAKADECGGFSRRRISSILKAPRKSIVIPNLEEQENVVEAEKPVEKKASRRVSFAAANDVFLLPNEVKKIPPNRSPLQDLLTTVEPSTYRVQEGFAVDGIQQITGMETLLNAPLHASRRGDKVSFDIGGDYGEKTVLFSADDAFMDMTRSHTINIANETEKLGDVSLQNSVFPSSGEKTRMSTAGDGSVDLTPSHTANIRSVPLPTGSGKDFNIKQGNICSAVPPLLPDFESFLARLFIPSGPSVNPITLPAGVSAEASNLSLANMKTQKADVDKENQPPTFLSAGIERSVTTSRTVGESSYGSMLCPKDDANMDKIETQTACIQAFVDEDSLHPTEDASCYPGNRQSQMAARTTQQQRRHTVTLDAKDECREKTILFTADDDFMDMTQSCTANISIVSGASAMQNHTSVKTSSASSLDEKGRETRGPPISSGKDLDPKLQNFHADIFKTSGKMNLGKEHCSQAVSKVLGESFHGATICPQRDVILDMTKGQTGRNVGHSGSDDVFLLSHPTEDRKPHCRKLERAEMASGERNSEAGLENPLKPFNKTNVETYQVRADAEDDCSDETIRCNTADSCMNTRKSLNAGSTMKDLFPLEKTAHNDKGMEPACLNKKLQRKTVFIAGDDCRDRTMNFTADQACMDMTRSHTVNIIRDAGIHSHHNVDCLPAAGEKNVPFTASSAAMDTMQRHPDVVTRLGPQSLRNVDCLPAGGGKTLGVDCMDMTQSHTSNIATSLNLHACQNVDFIPGHSEETVSFPANDAEMDTTQSHSVKITCDLKQRSDQSGGSLPTHGETTRRFDAIDAARNAATSRSVNTAVDGDAQPQQNVDVWPLCREESVKFSLNNAAEDAMESCPADAASKSFTQSDHPNVDTTMTLPPHRKRSSADCLDPGLKVSKATNPWTDPAITEAVPAATTQEPDVDATKEAPGLVPALLENPVDSTVEGPPEDERTAVPEAQTGRQSPQCSSTQNLFSDSTHLNKTQATPQQSSVALEAAVCKDGETPDHTDGLGSTEARTRSPSPNTIDHVDAAPSRKSRRASLADLHSKIQHLSGMMNPAPDTVVAGSCTAPLPRLEHRIDESKDHATSLPVSETEHEMAFDNVEINPTVQCLQEREQPSAANSQAQCLLGEEAASAAAIPFSTKTVQLMSRISVRGFKPKLPERGKPDSGKSATSGGGHARTLIINATKGLGHLDADVSDIFDEELDNCDDISEMLDVSPQKPTENPSPRLDCSMDSSLVDNVFEERSVSVDHGKKRLWPEGDVQTENGKRIRTSTEMTDFDMGSQPHVLQRDAVPRTASQSADDSSASQTAGIRCEATFESTCKQSLIDSQLESMFEDYASDVQRKLNEGTVTVLDFFKLFNIDFVIHNPRQSVRPNKVPSDTELTTMDLLKDRHISHPKQMVYETDVQALTERAEELKVRMRDLNKPLKAVNKALWEDVRKSSEAELRSFGAKLKERSNLFRKSSRVQSHEMKAALYSNIVQANLNEQQRLRGTIEKADEMLGSLDECIQGLEAELAAVEEKGCEDAPSLKSLQEEIKTVSEMLADNQRQISELEMQNEQNSKKRERLKAETRSLQDHIDALHLVNEWRFGGNIDNSVVYTFLHGTFHLQLLYQESEGNDAESQSEKKISQITFKHQFDAEKSHDHACLVHKLIAQYVDGEAAWVEKYPTSRFVPKLLHDVGLVVGRCRLLGEELRLLKMWGCVKLDILALRCVDTRVHIVFSSLKKFSKFEVTLSVGLTNLVCVLQMEDFKNIIGDTTRDQVEEIVASFSPGRNALTKMIKKIHEKLL